MRPGMITKAIDFAKKAHAGQVRKYTGEEYYTHPMAVALLVLETSKSHTQEMLVAAALHDTVEDTNVTLEDIESEFGNVVADYVYWLTDVSKPGDGNRATQKRLDREHIAKAPPEAQSIKLADIIHNTANIMANNKKFAEVYITEKVLLLEVLKAGDDALYKLACDQMAEYASAVRCASICHV